MPNLSKKLLTAALAVTMAVAPALAQALSVTSYGVSGQQTRVYTGGSGTSSTGIGSRIKNTSTGLKSRISNSGTGIGSRISNTSTGIGSRISNSGTGTGSRISNSSTGLGSGSTGSTGSRGVGLSTSDPAYKGVPGSKGKDNSSGGIGSSGSGTGATGSNSSTGVSTSDDDYKGVPGDGNKGNDQNSSTGISTEDDDYKGVPGSEQSLCNGKNYPRDIDGHWAEIYIRRLYDLCIIEGYSDGTFRPNHDVTRAELVKMSLYSKGIDPNTGCYDNDCGSPFNDLDSWQGKWIRPAWDRNIVKGYSNDKFKPNKAVTRAEAVKIILATYGYGPLGTSDSFFNDVNGWSVGWVEKAHNIGLVQGVGNGNFDPNRAITRAEAAKIIAKMMDYWDTTIR